MTRSPLSSPFPAPGAAMVGLLQCVTSRWEGRAPTRIQRMPPSGSLKRSLSAAMHILPELGQASIKAQQAGEAAGVGLALLTHRGPAVAGAAASRAPAPATAAAGAGPCYSRNTDGCCRSGSRAGVWFSDSAAGACGSGSTMAAHTGRSAATAENDPAAVEAQQAPAAAAGAGTAGALPEPAAHAAVRVVGALPEAAAAAAAAQPGPAAAAAQQGAWLHDLTTGKHRRLCCGSRCCRLGPMRCCLTAPTHLVAAAVSLPAEQGEGVPLVFAQKRGPHASLG